MVCITALIRHYKLEEVKASVADLGISGMSIVDVRGCGNSPESVASFAGHQVLVSLPVRAKITMVVPDELQEAVIQTILRHAHTGEEGDGKIFVERVNEAIRIRTLERGETAI